MLIMLLSALTALIFSLFLTPIVRRLAIWFKIFDTPNHRTMHKQMIPKLGGLSIFIAFTAGITVFAFSAHSIWNLRVIIIGSGIMLLVGLFDDIHSIGGYRKLLGQTLVAGFAVYFGFTVDSIGLPFGYTRDLGYFGKTLSVLWIVAITNSINLLDGLDGLAAGFSIIIAFFILIVAGIVQNVEVAAAALIFIAASLGFIKYNFPPAKIFMGDMGSLFMGFCLACLSLKVFTLPSSGCHFGALFVLFAVPLADTFLAIFRRLVQGKHPFSPDRKHVHHRLVEMGLNYSSAVLIIYAVTFICGFMALILLIANSFQTFILLSGIVIGFLVALTQLGCFDFLSNRYIFRKINRVGLHEKRTG